MLTSHTTPEQLPLFVYGTLRPSEPNYSFLRGNTIEEQPGQVRGMNLYALNNYPLAVQGSNTLVGEIMWLHPRTYNQLLTRLDTAEGYNPANNSGRYRRERCQIINRYNQIIVGWIYAARPELVTSAYRLIPHGDWLKYRYERIQHTRLRQYADADTRQMKGKG
jgi:gamma-glutamylcyclotransferase (GGCT)/AIG2-like uncharacterized protein YtfP